MICSIKQFYIVFKFCKGRKSSNIECIVMYNKSIIRVINSEKKPSEFTNNVTSIHTIRVSDCRACCKNLRATVISKF